MSDWIEFNIHNCAAIRVAKDAPTASLLRQMFAPFVTQGLDHHDLTITGEFEAVQHPSYGEHDYVYTASSLHINDTNVQIVQNGTGYRLHGKRELLVSALPIIDRILLSRGVAWIHAATVEYCGQGICLPAWGGVGKTSTIAKLLKLDGVSFMGDDWAFLTQDGRLLAYHKPMFIKPHHRPIYPHLFKKRRKPLVPSALTKSLARVATRVHPWMTQHPRLAQVTRKWSPEHLTVTPQEAFPEASFSNGAPLAIAIFIERYEADQEKLEARDRAWMVSRLIGNFNAEVSAWSREVMTAMAATSLMPIEKLFADKAWVMDRALQDKPTFLLQVPRAWSADQASDVIVEKIHEAMALGRVHVAKDNKKEVVKLHA
jgi:hypothetical protein